MYPISQNRKPFKEKGKGMNIVECFSHVPNTLPALRGSEGVTGERSQALKVGHASFTFFFFF